MENINLLTIFTTGLLTGGLTCMAVQGGLLATTIAKREEEKLLAEAKGEGKNTQGSVLPILSFLIAKLIAYTILGFFLGWVGSLVQLSLGTQVVLQVAVAIFMIGTALNMLNVHPIFRYFAIQPPRFLTRYIRKQSKRKDVFAPTLLGAFTVFIPCGTTQAMMALAIASGSPVLGAAVLFSFVLGTGPVFFLLGYLTTKLGDVLHERFTKIAATAIILLALFNINNAIALTGSNFTAGKVLSALNCTISFCGDEKAEEISAPTNTPVITIKDWGYEPQQISVKAGSEVTLKLVNNDGRGCAQAFTIPSYNIQTVVGVGQTDTVTFTAPKEKGEITFMCSMGMYQGKIKVI